MWISIKERYPENEQKVVFYIKERELCYVGDFEEEDEIMNVKRKNVFRESVNGWWFEDEEITHWLPLPPLPKDME